VSSFGKAKKKKIKAPTSEALPYKDTVKRNYVIQDSATNQLDPYVPLDMG